jgi:phage tail-like protein
MECTGLESKTEIIRYREGSDRNTPRLLPGLNTYTGICLKKGVTDSKELYSWRKTVIDGQTVRKNGSIILHDNKHQEVARWNFIEGWPSRMSGPQLNALGNEVAIEELEIAHEGFERV